MKILAVTYGTEGDTRPIAALCRALMDAGHATHLMADQHTLESARAVGVPCTALVGDIVGALRSEQASSSLLNKKQNANDTAKALASIANQHTKQWLQAVLAAGAGCDVIIAGGLAAFVGLSAGEALNIPVVGAGMFPITPTREFANPFLPVRNFPRWFNRLSSVAINEMLWLYFKRAVNDARVKLANLPPRRWVWKSHPMIYGMSRHLVPQPADWPSNTWVCGQWQLQPADWQPSVTLLDFLAADEPPIYVGFGSMSMFLEQAQVDAIVQALADRRVLFYAGWGGLDAKPLPKNFFRVEAVPHHWLFPQVSCVIHHGGSGTAHAASIAGVPSIVLPFAGDQFFWAKRLESVGIAPPCVSAQHITAHALSGMLQFVERAEVRARAKAIGVSMAAEDGKAKAISIIERLVQSQH